MNEERIVKRRTWSVFSSLALVWSASLLLSVLGSLVALAAMPTFVTAGIIRPVTLVTLLVTMTLFASLVNRNRLEAQWQEAVNLMPIAALGVLIMSGLRIWNDGSGTIALSLGDASLFMATAGLLPARLGPDVFLRGMAFMLSVLLAWRAWRRDHRLQSVAGVFLAAWIPSALFLLSQSWIALIAGAFRRTAIEHSLDATRVLSAIHASSYWSGFQSDRFFAGIGRQLETGAALSSTSLVFLFGCVAMCGWLFRSSPWNRSGVLRAMGRRLVSARSSTVVSSFSIGLWVALRSQRLTLDGIDLIALVLVCIVLFAWMAWWMFGRDMENLTKDELSHPERPLPSGLVRPDELDGLRQVLLVIAIIGALLLGWPVFLGMLGLVGVSWLASSQGFGWAQSPRDRIPFWAAVAAILVMMGGAFGVRNVLLPQGILFLSLAWAALAAVLAARKWLTSDRMPFWAFFAAVGGVSILWSLLFSMPVILALAALLLVGLVILRKNPTRWNRYASPCLIIFGWLATLMGEMGR